MDRKKRFLEFASQIFGRETIDWRAVEEEFSRPQDLDLFKRLRALAELAENEHVGAILGSDKLSARVTSLMRGLPDVTVGGSDPQFVPGDRLASRYRIVGFLGRGGMGAVYEVRDEELSVSVALKTLLRGIGADGAALRSLKREVLLARSIAHSHVCRVYDLGWHESDALAVWFLTMELLRGETLRERIRRLGRLTPAEALPLVEQMAAGLGAAHRSGVVHGDFKSANVMLVGEASGERAVVMDFGLARMVEATGGSISGSFAMSGLIAGTPAYMAPEQMFGSSTQAADIYALGVVLYEMVTGKLPFEGKTVLELAVQRLTEEAPSPRREVPDLEERWEAVILQCLSRDPGNRFAEPADVVKALEQCATLETIDLASPTPRPLHVLPSERDAFLGRKREIEDLERRFAAGSRLVTLLGAAGMGKTRLAVRYGWQSLDRWPGGVWFCSLGEASPTVNGIVSAVAGSLGIPLGKEDPVEQLGHAIANRGRCLVLLDNFERAARHAEETVGRWLERAPEARFVVTSRERLGLWDEEVQTVEPLAIESGVELFIERARRQRASFEPRERELESVREMVRLVEGMPLAIELAAARVRMMTVGQVVERMRERLPVLGGGREGPHGSLRTAIEGSWDLLKSWEQAAWAQCSVFDGGFTLEAAESVVDLTAWPDAPWVVDVIQSLVDKSLLRTWVVGDGDVPEIRFGMYVSLQEYARERLGKEGEIENADHRATAARGAEDRHARWFARYGTAIALDALHGGEERWRELRRELDNLHVACRRAIARGDGETATAAYIAMCEDLLLQGPLETAVERGQEVLGLELGIKDRARVLVRLGTAERHSGRVVEARSHYETALSILRDVGDQRTEGLAHSGLGALHLAQGRVQEALEHQQTALAMHRKEGNRHSEGMVLVYLGNLHRRQGRMEEARTHYQAAQALHRETGDRHSEGIALANFGSLHVDQGRITEARVHYDAALALLRAAGNIRLEGVVLSNLGNLDLKQGRMEEARVHYDAALDTARRVGDRRAEGGALCNLGHLAGEQGRFEEAHRHYHAALAIHRELHDLRSQGDILRYLGNLYSAVGRAEEARIDYEAALAIHRELGNRSDERFDLHNLGQLHWTQGEVAEARTNFDAALVIHRELGDRHSEGLVLGFLGDLDWRQGRIEDARKALARAESILRELGNASELGQLLCSRAEMESECGNVAAALNDLQEAEVLAEQVGAELTSEFGQQLAKIRRELRQES